MSPKVTVLIPTHDHVETIKYSIASVQAQTIKDFELFVVGDGAPHETKNLVNSLAQTDSRIRYFDSPKGEGHGELHRAETLKQARGDIVCYLGDDDMWLSHHLSVMLELLDKADFAHTNQTGIWPDGMVVVDAGNINDVSTRWKMLNQKWNLFGPSCAGHTLEAYKRLPYGWRPKPDGMYSDLHMWRQWLAQPWCRFISEPQVTIMRFPSPWRRGWTIEERVKEMENWWQRSKNPQFSKLV